MIVTKHAATRMAQLSISPEMVEAAFHHPDLFRERRGTLHHWRRFNGQLIRLTIDLNDRVVTVSRSHTCPHRSNVV